MLRNVPNFWDKRHDSVTNGCFFTFCPCELFLQNGCELGYLLSLLRVEDGLEPFHYGWCGIHHEFLADGGRLEIAFLPSVGAVADGSAPHGIGKSPSAPAASLFCQYPPLVKSEGAGSRQFWVDGELPGGKEDGVLFPFPILIIFVVVGVRMFPQPFRYVLFLSYDFTYLEVAIDGVYVFGATQVAEFCRGIQFA